MRGRPSTGRGPGRIARTGGTVVAALLGIVLSAGAALADPAPPGTSHLEAATARVQELTQELAGLASRMAAAQAAVDAARENSAIALDTYQAQEQAYQDAAARASAAQAAAGSARQALDAGQQRLEAFARSSYIDGSTSPGAAALFTFDGPADLVDRAVLLGAVGADRAEVLARLGVLQQEAAAADAAARTSLAAAASQKLQAADALASAQTAERAARTQRARLVAEQAAAQAAVDRKRAVLAGLVGPDAAAAIVQSGAEAGRAGIVPRSLGVLVGNPVLAAPGSATAAQQAAAAQAVAAAAAHLGTPYAWGGGGAGGPGPGIDLDAGVVGFDCSGLTQYAYARAGIAIPRNSRAQYAALPKVTRTDLRPGDLVFWAQDPADPGTIHHVALYLGGGRVLHAPESGQVVTISPIWWDGYAGAVRPGS